MSEATWDDLAERFLPGFPDEVRGYVLWNHTAFPFASPLHTARQLRKFYRRYRAGWSECSICGRAYRHAEKVLLGGLCGNCGN